MHAMESLISLDLEARARMDLMVHGAMWMRTLAARIRLRITERFHQPQHADAKVE